MNLRACVLAACGALAAVVFGATAACSGPREAPSDGGDARGEAGTDSRTDAPDADELAEGADAAADSGTDAGVPRLVSLSVTSAGVEGGAPVTLTPAFSPGVHDYYVLCSAAAGNALTVSMTASPGAESLLLQPSPPSQKKPSQTLDVSVDANGAVVAAATDGVATTTYWVRCLPPDFPAMAWTPHADAGTPPPGYYLLGWWLAPPGGAGYGMILDGNGVPVWYTRPPNRYGVTDLDSLAPGELSFTLFDGAPTGPFDVLGLRPYTTEVIAPLTDPATIHELQVLPNGDHLILANPIKYGVDLTGLTVKVGSTPTPLGKDQMIEDCVIVEFDAAGSLVWTWTATDHFEPRLVSAEPQVAFDGEKTDGGTGPLVDVFHCNSIDLDRTSPDPGHPNMLVSARNMDSIFYVERATRRVLWKMGGPSSSLDDAAYVTPSTPFFLQHDARLQPDWTSTCGGGRGHISLFDDETHHGAHARGLLFDVSVGAKDGGAPADAACPPDGGPPSDAGPSGEGGGAPAGTATLTSRYEKSGVGASIVAGSFRILSDGSYVVGWGQSETAGVVFTEFDGKGNDLLDFSFPASGQSYRTVKVPLTELRIDDLRNAAGLPPPPLK